jgi:hypothetical protein
LRASLRKGAPTKKGTLETMPDTAPPFDQRNALEDALVAASSDPTKRGPFLRLLLDSTVYVIGRASDPSAAPVVPNETASPAISSLGLASYTVSDGGSATPFYSSREWLSGCLKEPAPVLAVPARVLFEATRGERLVLNWGAPWVKEFTPAEIANLLDHGGSGKRITVDEPREVLLGLPATEPTVLLAALTTVLTHHPEVSAGYMGWMHDPATTAPPHAIIGLDGEGNLDAATGDAVAAATGVSPDAPVDFFRITPGDGSVSDFLLTGGKQFYTRGGE